MAMITIYGKDGEPRVMHAIDAKNALENGYTKEPKPKTKPKAEKKVSKPVISEK